MPSLLHRLEKFSLSFLGLAIALVSLPISAATIKKIDRKKKLVMIDEGSNASVTKGSKVCFKDPEGSELGCGKTTKVKPDTAIVKVSSKVIKKLKKEYEATVTPAAEGTAEEKSEMVTGETKATKDAELKTSKTTKLGKRSNFKLLYILTPVGVTKFNRLSYQAPPESGGTVQPTSSLWSSIGTVTQSLLGFGLEGEFAIGTSSSLAVGLRQKKYSEFKVENDYSTGTDPEDRFHFAETTQSASAMGFWFDFYYVNAALSPSFSFRFGNGIDYDASQVDIKVTHKYDGTQIDAAGNQEFEIASATSKASTISLRTVLNTHFLIDPIGFNFALNLLLPLSTSATFSSTIGDPNKTAVTGTSAEDDLKNALNHSKSSFAVEAVIGGYFAF